MTTQDGIVYAVRELLYLTSAQVCNRGDTEMSGFLSEIDELRKNLEYEVDNAPKFITGCSVLMSLLACVASNLDGIIKTANSISPKVQMILVCL